MQERINTRGTLRSMKIGEDYLVPFAQMSPQYLWILASQLKRAGIGIYKVSADKLAQVSTVTRTA